MSEVSQTEQAVIFINYRRTDAGWSADLLESELKRTFGKGRVFLDVRGIDAGDEIAAVIEEKLGRATILVVLIGKGWLQVQDKYGRRRLDQRRDWVRREIRTSLQQEGCTVIPVLIDDANLPDEREALPKDIAMLLQRRAIQLRQANSGDDIEALKRELERAGFRRIPESGEPRLKAERKGTESAVLENEIQKIFEEVIRNEPSRWGEILQRVPRKIEEIPSEGNLRTDFSHKFRSKVDEKLQGELGEKLKSSPDLCTALHDSEYDLDQLVLFIWLRLQLRDVLNVYHDLMERRMSWIEEEGGKGRSPSLNPTFRLVDSLREGLSEGLPPLLRSFENAIRWINNTAERDPDLDTDQRTRQLLEDGLPLLGLAQGWQRPRKSSEQTKSARGD
jgi:TIR domain